MIRKNSYPETQTDVGIHSPFSKNRLGMIPRIIHPTNRPPGDNCVHGTENTQKSGEYFFLEASAINIRKTKYAIKLINKTVND